MSLQDDYDSLRRLHNAVNDSIISLQEKNKQLHEEIQMRDEKLINCQAALDINKEIMRNALTEQNRVQTEYGAEIQELRVKIKQLEG